MIRIGFGDQAKRETVDRYCAEHDIERIFVCSPARFAPSWAAEKMVDHVQQGDGRRGVFLDWPDIIEYRFYYRLLQEIEPRTLVVVNECLRSQNRHILTYNCLRLFLNQTKHHIIFQRLPVLDTWSDFATLFDFDTRGRWKREKIDAEQVLRECDVQVAVAPPTFRAIEVPVSRSLAREYLRQKAKLLSAVRADVDKDPHLVPRNLLLVSGTAKVPAVDPAARYVGRNNRFKLPNVETYRDVATAGPRVLFEPPHNFIDLTDYLAIAEQSACDVLVADTKADRWYFDRLTAWSARMREVIVSLGGAS